MAGADIRSSLRKLVGGRLAVYLQLALDEYDRGRVRGAYDYAQMALLATLFELGASGDGLFAKLAWLKADGKLGSEVLERARQGEFLRTLDAGATDLALSYLSADDLSELLAFLVALYRSLAEHGVMLAGDPRGQ